MARQVRRLAAYLLRWWAGLLEVLARQLRMVSLRLVPGAVLGGVAAAPPVPARLPWQPGPPPPHWVQLVQRRAPQLLARPDHPAPTPEPEPVPKSAVPVPPPPAVPVPAVPVPAVPVPAVSAPAVPVPAVPVPAVSWRGSDGDHRPELGPGVPAPPTPFRPEPPGYRSASSTVEPIVAERRLAAEPLRATWPPLTVDPRTPGASTSEPASPAPPAAAPPAIAPPAIAPPVISPPAMAPPAAGSQPNQRVFSGAGQPAAPAGSSHRPGSTNLAGPYAPAPPAPAAAHLASPPAPRSPWPAGFEERTSVEPRPQPGRPASRSRPGRPTDSAEASRSPWPSLLDDAPLWTDPAGESDPDDTADAVTVEHLERLDAEQRGRPWSA